MGYLVWSGVIDAFAPSMKKRKIQLPVIEKMDV
jgi:hypothetical protein